ncbi:MAG: alanine--tRNA ligase [Anaerolineae bacterium]|jgi:alanyl-tRNA synthetase
MRQKKWTSFEVRQSFLDFFARRGHKIVPSASLVPKDDPTLLFTNAGMNQFKDVFLGVGTREYTRAADTQKCMRVSGKHNDLDDVGRDTYHHTFFEMLGNWSFGDYYKQEVIRWAWELLTEVWELPKEHVWATCFQDEYGELERDDEAAGFWRSETDINPDHILFFGRKDNFWEMGDTGPCGPCSEIHLDRGPGYCDKQNDPDHVCAVNGNCARYLELWNLVFIQYNHLEDDTLEPLPNRHIDTGAGFERLVAVLQDVDSNYQTDLFIPIMDRVQALLGHTDAQRHEQIVGYRVIADHARAATFCIGDGVLPGSDGRNYVLRMIIRRAIRFGREIGFSEPFMDQVCQVVIDMMSSVFPELEKRREFILATIQQEEERFLRTLDMGLTRLDEVLDEVADRGQTVVPGEDVFRLYDTFGLPLEITRDVVKDRGFTIDEEGYHVALEAQRARARAADTFEGVDEESRRVYQQVLEQLQAEGALDASGVTQDPYRRMELETTVLALLRDGESVSHVQAGDQVEVVLPQTCFYVEAGGQVSDIGAIVASRNGAAEPAWRIAVQDAKEPVPGLIVHVGQVMKGEPQVGDSVTATVAIDRRMDIARNHTATHLLHEALREVLGAHVQQAGSLVAPDRLRFDFTHNEALSQDELEQIVERVNAAILANYPVVWDYQPYREALEAGVTALFGEKYGDVVRVLRIGGPDEPFSQELCGGTHVDKTGVIGVFYIISEQGIGSGVRRIEAVTGRGAVAWTQRQLRTLRAAAASLACPPEAVDRKVLDLMDELHETQREIDRLQQRLARGEFEQLLDRVERVGDVPLLAAEVHAADMDTLREMTDWFRDRIDSGVVLLGAVIGERPAFVAAVTPDLVERGIDAVTLVRGVARVVGGGGGGRPTLAQAGGKEPQRLHEALQQVPKLLEEALP